MYIITTLSLRLFTKKRSYVLDIYWHWVLYKHILYRLYKLYIYKRSLVFQNIYFERRFHRGTSQEKPSPPDTRRNCQTWANKVWLQTAKTWLTKDQDTMTGSTSKLWWDNVAEGAAACSTNASMSAKAFFRTWQPIFFGSVWPQTYFEPIWGWFHGQKKIAYLCGWPSHQINNNSSGYLGYKVTSKIDDGSLVQIFRASAKTLNK